MILGKTKKVPEQCSCVESMVLLWRREVGETHFRCGQSPLAPVRGNNFGKRKSNIKYNLVWRFKFMSISQPFQHTSHQFIRKENHISTVYEAHFHQRCREQKISRFSSFIVGLIELWYLWGTSVNIYWKRQTKYFSNQVLAHNQGFS